MTMDFGKWIGDPEPPTAPTDCQHEWAAEVEMERRTGSKLIRQPLWEKKHTYVLQDDIYCVKCRKSYDDVEQATKEVENEESR